MVLEFVSPTTYQQISVLEMVARKIAPVAITSDPSSRRRTRHWFLSSLLFSWRQSLSSSDVVFGGDDLRRPSVQARFFLLNFGRFSGRWPKKNKKTWWVSSSGSVKGDRQDRACGHDDHDDDDDDEGGGAFF